MITYEIFVKLVSDFSKNSEKKKKDFQSFSVFMELQFLHLFIYLFGFPGAVTFYIT